MTINRIIQYRSCPHCLAEKTIARIKPVCDELESIAGGDVICVSPPRVSEALKAEDDGLCVEVSINGHHLRVDANEDLADVVMGELGRAIGQMQEALDRLRNAYGKGGEA